MTQTKSKTGAAPRALVTIATTLSLLAGACSSGNGTPAEQSVTCTNGTIVAREANNYAFSSTITLPPVTVKSQTNLKFDWSAVTKDFEGHAVNSANPLDTAVVMLWNLKLSDLETALNADMLNTNALVVSPPPSLGITGGATSAMLYDFTLNGTPIMMSDFDMYFDASMYMPSNSTYLAAVQTGTQLGSGIRMLQAFNVDASSQNTTVTLTNSSTQLSYHADLLSLHPTGIPMGNANLTLDWSQMTTNALGAPFDTSRITSAIVGHYTQTPSQLQTQFLDLQTIGTDFYTANIDTGTVLDFTTLKDSSGNSFPGVDANGTWLVGLICGNCRNPAPWYMTVLVPAEQPCASM